MSRPKVRGPYDVERVQVRFDQDEGGAKQSFKDECDINRIVDSYARTGIVNHVARRRPEYGDAPDIDAFEAACIAADAASALEEGLPGQNESGDSEGSEGPSEGTREGAQEEAPEEPENDPGGERTADGQ